MNRKENFTVRFIRENPVFSLYPGLCSTLTTTATLNNAIGMGVTIIVVLIMPNVIISLVRNITLSEIHILVYIVIIATPVRIIQMLTKAYVSSLGFALGILTPLIAVNRIILGRAETLVSRNDVFGSALDGFGMGLRYAMSIILMSVIHQIVATRILSLDSPFGATWSIFSIRITPEDFTISTFSQPFDAFCTFVCLVMGLVAHGSHQRNRVKKLEKEAK